MAVATIPEVLGHVGKRIEQWSTARQSINRFQSSGDGIHDPAEGIRRLPAGLKRSRSLSDKSIIADANGEQTRKIENGLTEGISSGRAVAAILKVLGLWDSG